MPMTAASAAAYVIAGSVGIYLPEDFDPSDPDSVSYPEYPALKEAENNGFNADRGDLAIESAPTKKEKPLSPPQLNKKTPYFSSA